MNTLRTAAQQALEALELGYDSAKAEADQYHAAMAGYRQQRHDQMDADVQQIASAITALRAALAEPEPPPEAQTEAEKIAYCAGWWGALAKARKAEPTPLEDVVTHGSAWSKNGKRIDPMSVYAEPVQEPVQEPVAWSHINGTSDTKWHPPQRKPLTEEEIRDLWSWAMTAEAERTATTQQHAFARAVERAHGIT